MSSKVNHTNRSSRIKHFNKTNFNGMVRRKRLRDYYFGENLYNIHGARLSDASHHPTAKKFEGHEELAEELGN